MNNMIISLMTNQIDIIRYNNKLVETIDSYYDDIINSNSNIELQSLMISDLIKKSIGKKYNNANE